MSGQGDMRMPCGRRSYCGRADCRHTTHCRALQARKDAGPETSAPHRTGAAPRDDARAKALAGKRAEPRPLAAPTDVVYLYDGSLPGLYTCVHECVYTRQLPFGIYPEQEAQPTFYDQKLIVTDQEKALRVRASIQKKISGRALELVEAVFLSCLEDKEIKTLKFLLLGYRQGRKTTDMLGHPEVAALLDAEKHMGGEAHLLKGFVRFSDYDGVLAATISPKNFVLPFLADHFAARYSGERFMIYDKTHKAALIYENRQHRIVPLEGIEFPQADETEERYRALWKRFYKTIAIEARTNPKCRMTHMPKRYWENMTEMREFL